PVLEGVRDCGDVLPEAGGIAETHRSAAGRICEISTRTRTIVVGGGHDHGYSQLAGIARAFPGKSVGCINVDAHLDVRKPKSDREITSGSPFYLALESGVLKPDNLVEFGIQSQCNSPELWAYVREKRARIVPFEE